MQGAKPALRLARIVVFAVAAAAVSPAFAGTFLDNTLGDVRPEDRVAVANPKPVQVLFEFQNNGSPNAKAQAFLHDRVIADIKQSGVFSDAGDAPVTDNSVLSVMLDNVADLKQAEGKGFKTGLTLGLASSTVTDGYICTVTFVSGDAAKPKLVKTANHAIFTTMGLFGSDPPNATKMKGMDEAAFTMTDQVLAHTLNDLAADPAFNPNAPAPRQPAAADGAAPAATPTPAAPTPATAPAPAATQQ